MLCCVHFLTQPGYSPDNFDDLGSTAVDSLPPVEMPDIPDFTDWPPYVIQLEITIHGHMHATIQL